MQKHVNLVDLKKIYNVENEVFLAKCGFYTAENGLFKVWDRKLVSTASNKVLVAVMDKFSKRLSFQHFRIVRKKRKRKKKGKRKKGEKGKKRNF